MATTQCKGTTKTGERCQQKPALGSDFCGLHAPGRVVKRRTRSRAFGTVRQLESGRYQASYLQDGVRHLAPQTFRTKADANSFLANVETDIFRSQWIDPKAGTITVRAYAEKWLAAGVGRGRIRPTTEAKYRGLLDRHILPTFGDSQMGKVKVAHVRDWNDALAAEAASTAAGAYRLLATIFNSAVRDEIILRSPCKVEGASREHARERPTATVAECQAAVDAVPEETRCAVLLAAWGQLRRSEVLALQRRDIDLTAGTVSVARAWLVMENGKTLLHDEPKSAAGRRTIHLPDNVQKALKAHLSAYVGIHKTAWLFPGGNGDPMHPRTFARIWARAREQVERPDLRFHDLRHSGLTWVAQAGATTAEIMRRAGHASPVAASRYQHAADQRDKALAEALGKLA